MHRSYIHGNATMSQSTSVKFKEMGGGITFRNGTRSVRMWITEDNSGFLLEFEKDGHITPLQLSRDAMNAVLELHNRLTWGDFSDCATDEAAVIQETK